MEEGLFPHKRSIDSEESIEEERRLCYVGMTRAMRKLYITHARSRRRYGGGPPEPSIASRFLREIPPSTVKKMHTAAGSAREVELFSEQYEVRNTVRKNLYTGKTYNSVENIAQFFKDRGVQAPPPPRPTAVPQPPVNRASGAGQTPASAPVRPSGAPSPSGGFGSRTASAPPATPRPGGTPPPSSYGQPGALRPPVKPGGTSAKPGSGSGSKGKLSPGSVINHPTLGRGTIVKKEGEGPDAKLTVSFPGVGLKKLIAKFAGLSDE
jgi:DNA helicase II / ATP-dependent DNA helicase PcrA